MPDPATMTAIVANGSSELFSALALGVVTLLFNRSLMHHIGSLGVAAFAMSQYLLMLGAVFFNGLSAGAQPILGYNCGSGATDRVRGTLVRLLGVGAVVSVLPVVAGRTTAGALAALDPSHHLLDFCFGSCRNLGRRNAALLGLHVEVGPG